MRASKSKFIEDPLGISVEERIRHQVFCEIANAMPQIVWTAQPDGWTDYFNRHWFKYTGLTLEQTQGYGWESVIHPEDFPHCIERWTHAFQTGDNYEVEYRFKRADNTYRWHLGRALPVRDARGNIIKWFGTCTDIEEQKHALEVLQQTDAAIIKQLEARLDELVTQNTQLKNQLSALTQI